MKGMWRREGGKRREKWSLRERGGGEGVRSGHKGKVTKQWSVPQWNKIQKSGLGGREALMRGKVGF